MTPTNYTWSYSSIELFGQCPHKYYRLRVKRDIVEPESDAMRYGLDAHKAAEDYVRDDVPLPAKFSFLQPMLDKLKTYEGERLCEYKMGLTKALEPCDFYDKQVWWRGIADLIVLQGDKAKIVDYKTGKSSKYADTKQLELLSLAVFKHFPQIKHIKGGLLFVVVNDFVQGKYSADESNTYWARWLPKTAMLEKSFENGAWNPRPNFTCQKWCPVKDCIHNGKGR